MNEPREGRSDLDETLEETFPASDAPANTVETGIRLAADPLVEQGVRDNHDAKRFELVVDGQIAYLEYERQPGALVLVHTDVPPALRGRRLGEALIKAAFETARRAGLRVVPVCPYVKAFLRKHPDRGEG